jgi:hypothetical protein
VVAPGRIAAAWPQTRRSGKVVAPDRPDAPLEDFWQAILGDFDHWEILAQASPAEIMEGYQLMARKLNI